MALFDIVHEVHTLSFPDKPIFMEIRAAAVRGVVIQCVASSLLLAICVWCWHREVDSKYGNDDAQANRSRLRFQFGIADALGWTTALAICLSLWAWLGSWLLPTIVGTLAFQAYTLLRPPVRLSIGIAWLAVWAFVGLMIAAGIG